MPFWPQLPRRSPYENMVNQFIEGFVIATEDIEKGRIYINTGDHLDEKLALFYEKILSGDLDFFSITKKYALGLHDFLSFLLKKEDDLQFVKGQITGPITMGLVITDEEKKAIIYNETLFEAIIALIKQKIKWMEKRFFEIKKDLKVVMFIDEPSLASFGSAFSNFPKEQVINSLNEIFADMKSLPGIHCCANTDWSLIFETNVKIVSFDAYSYFNNLSLYKDDIVRFIKNGGVLSWGIVPTDDNINKEDALSLFSLLEKEMNQLIDMGIDKEILIPATFITPSCGTGTLTIPQAEKALNLTKEIALMAKDKWAEYL